MPATRAQRSHLMIDNDASVLNLRPDIEGKCTNQIHRRERRRRIGVSEAVVLPEIPQSGIHYWLSRGKETRESPIFRKTGYLTYCPTDWLDASIKIAASRQFGFYRHSRRNHGETGNGHA